MGDVMRELCLLRALTMYCTVQSRRVCAPTPIYPLVVIAQATSETSENNVLAFRKETVVCNMTHSMGIIMCQCHYCGSRLCVCVTVILCLAVEYFYKSQLLTKNKMTNMGE